jgi:hypothetical protein
MDLSPRLLGVSAAVLVAGIAAGAALGTVPPMQQRGTAEWLPEARPVAFAHRRQADLPDHYPLVTRAGTIEVHELGERGLYRQARYAWRQLDAYYPEEEDWAGHDSDAVAEPQPAVVYAAATDTGAPSWRQPEPEAATAPLEPVGAAVAEVTPRIVDVAAELARRGGSDGAVAFR